MSVAGDGPDRSVVDQSSTVTVDPDTPNFAFDGFPEPSRRSVRWIRPRGIAERRPPSRSASAIRSPAVPPSTAGTSAVFARTAGERGRHVPRSAGQETALVVRELTKVYGSGPLAVSAVRHVTFEVTRGEVVLIMGPSGSGKTTLLLMLGAMLRPTAGSVVIDGTDITQVPERKLPRIRSTHLGFVFQDFNLLSALSAAENVALACNLAGVRGRRAYERARLLLERVDLGHRMRARPDQLSGGEKQRVALARALANDPPVLLADEPTANLDSAHGREIGELLRRLADEDQRTSLIVTHDDRLVRFADRTLWLEDGVLHQRGHR
ncbi:MAG: ABC transporter ATP-binding protein [Acidimicrobiales bacterium]|nr:ABC transporter ATP-binding protein [Acidimicrobiales bacterium]